MKPMITVTNDHGTFTASGYAVDAAIDRYLPASINDLRKIVRETLYEGKDLDYVKDLSAVSEMIIMLAEIIQNTWNGRN